MDDTDDPAKLEAALEQLEAEKARRRQAKIDSGEIVLVETTVVLGARDDDEEKAIARAIALYPAPDDGREVHREFTFAVTGVPRGDPDQAESSQVQTDSSDGPSHPPSPEVEAASGPLIPHSQPTPTYVRVVVSNGSDGDPRRHC
jgi:hypothetical protein